MRGRAAAVWFRDALSCGRCAHLFLHSESYCRHFCALFAFTTAGHTIRRLSVPRGATSAAPGRGGKPPARLPHGPRLVSPPTKMRTRIQLHVRQVNRSLHAMHGGWRLRNARPLSDVIIPSAGIMLSCIIAPSAPSTSFTPCTSRCTHSMGQAVLLPRGAERTWGRRHVLGRSVGSVGE